MTKPPLRLLLVAAVVPVLATGCGDGAALQTLALSDEVASVCGDLAARMAEGWQRSERARRRRVTFAEADLPHLDTTRARCKGALDLLMELDGERRPLQVADAEANLQSLLALDRLLLRSIVEPRMDSEVFAATHAQFVAAYVRTRPRLTTVLPLGPDAQQQQVGKLLPRWDAKTKNAGGR